MKTEEKLPAAVLLHDILRRAVRSAPDHTALEYNQQTLSYALTHDKVRGFQQFLKNLGISEGDRVGILLPNCPEMVISIFGTSFEGGVFVPINPILRHRQLKHILTDSGCKILVTSSRFLAQFSTTVTECEDLNTVILTDETRHTNELNCHLHVVGWPELSDSRAHVPGCVRRESDIAAILYSSGSTGPAKGIVLSHSNLVTGAEIVSAELENTCDDRILAALPLSFDYGFSQVTTGFYVGATVVLTNYGLPLALVNLVSNARITALAGVPTMWAQIASLEWPDDATKSLRYATNSGGILRESILQKLQDKLPSTRIFLMYGLTEAFRSTILDPGRIDSRPTSIGKAVAKVEIRVIDSEGNTCAPGEEGELLHIGSLVSMGYWNDHEATKQRFVQVSDSKLAPGTDLPAVLSGDIAKADNQGFLYFVGRSDSMIKTSGYRVSPFEIEEVVLSIPDVQQAAAIGIIDVELGQAIALAIVTSDNEDTIRSEILKLCSLELPPYMQPSKIQFYRDLPITANGKIDLYKLATTLADPSLVDNVYP